VDTNKAYIHNHVNIEIDYRLDDTNNEKYQVVRFTVAAFSINHEFELFDKDNNEDGKPGVRVHNGIPSCDPSIPDEIRRHTNYNAVTDKGREPQLASGAVLWTYDVIWTERSNIHWADRWNVYLDMEGPFQTYCTGSPLFPQP
jgi:hypothetical protein